MLSGRVPLDVEGFDPGCLRSAELLDAVVATVSDVDVVRGIYGYSCRVV